MIKQFISEYKQLAEDFEKELGDSQAVRQEALNL